MPSSGTCTSIINLRYQDGSEGSQSNPAKYKNQDYAQLKDDNLREGRLFLDRTFPPNSASLGDLGLSYLPDNDAEWLRPSEILRAHNINSEPVFCSKGASRFDFSQGYVGNCWFLAAISSLTFHEHLMAQVVPMDQSFNNYAGIFHFRFWRFGKWVDVVIDDHLPTHNKQLLSVKIKGDEFWGPLLEKAYAKVCGSYADMSSGLPSDACKDFTGGVSIYYNFKEEHSLGHEELWLQLSRAAGCNSMICCGTPPKGGTMDNTTSDTGLVDAHAYSITDVAEVSYYGSKVRLVRIMNPWGDTEWNGKWNDNCDMWKSVSQEDREKCFNHEDGEFWMELKDFCCNFSMLSICCENPNFLDGDYTCQWKSMTYDGSWVSGINAGGRLYESVGSFATNPQYRIQVKIIDEKQKGDQNVVLSLMQKPEQEHRKERKFHSTALTIFKVPPGTKQGHLGSSFFNGKKPVKDQQMYSCREVVELHSLQPGEYVIIPSTIKPHTDAEFVLTVYTKADAQISPHPGGGDDDDHKEAEKEVPKTPDEETTDVSRSLFNRYADQNGELSAWQLHKLLNDQFAHGTYYGFSVDTCSSMIAMVDLDKRMTMTYTEFSILWKKMNEFKDLFHRSDLNGNGSLTKYELQKAIQAAGIDTNDSIVSMMMFRYSGFSSTSLEQFITLMLRLEYTSDIFNGKSINGTITLTWDEWSIHTMYS